MMLLTANIFQPLIDVFQSVLVFIHNSLSLQWGLSIVVLTILIRALMIPLTVKQFHSMQQLQRHQPEMKAIQAKYKDDKQRQQQELMKFYKENNVNPLGSCLPMALQLPVFISLFYMLRQDLRVDICPAVQPHHLVNGISKVVGPSTTVPCGPHNGAGFLFITDLTNNAKGVSLIILLLLYVGTQLGSSLVMQSPTMDKTQRQIMLFMPLIFVLVVIRFPAGVLLYWITTNTWTIGQQLIVKRWIGPPGAPPVAVASANGSSPPVGKAAAADGPTGGGPSRALAGLRRDRSKDGDARSAETGGGTETRERTRGAPPPSARKKKKRSGRRR
jgi:YidC/Oxa1 family membrane protein insertase